MNERAMMESEVLRGRLMVMGLKPHMAHVTDLVGEYLVVFDYPASGMKAERVTVRFRTREDRDEWWRLYKSGFDI